MSIKDRIIEKVSSFPTLPTMADGKFIKSGQFRLSGSILFGRFLIRSIFSVGDKMGLSDVGVIIDLFQSSSACNRIRTFRR